MLLHYIKVKLDLTHTHMVYMGCVAPSDTSSVKIWNLMLLPLLARANLGKKVNTSRSDWI